MKKTILFILIILSNQVVCFSQQAFSILSKKVYKHQKATDKSTFNITKLFYKSRQSLIKAIKKEIKQPIDTLYLVEGYDLQSGDVVATVWCNQWKYNYRYNQNKITILDSDNFSKELYSQTMLGKAKTTLNKDFGSIAGLASKVYSRKKKFNIIFHSFEE